MDSLQSGRKRDINPSESVSAWRRETLGGDAAKQRCYQQQRGKTKTGRQWQTTNDVFKERGSKWFYFPGLENIVWHRSRSNWKMYSEDRSLHGNKEKLERKGMVWRQSRMCVRVCVCVTKGHQVHFWQKYSTIQMVQGFKPASNKLWFMYLNGTKHL